MRCYQQLTVEAQNEAFILAGGVERNLPGKGREVWVAGIRVLKAECGW